MTAEHFRGLLWNLALIFGWLSIVPLIMVYQARRKFHALLKEPLNDEVEHLTHSWEKRLGRWTALGFLVPGLSIACFVGWLVLGSAS